MTYPLRKIKMVAVVSAVAFLGSAAPSFAAEKVTFSVDAPTVQGSFVSGVVTETFDDGCVNPLEFGTVTGDCISQDPIYYAGASSTSGAPFTGGVSTPFASVGMGGAITVDLTRPARYLGFHWEAGNEFDRVRLYSDGDLIADFSFETLMSALEAIELDSADGLTSYTAADYFGNPVNGEQIHEPYAYVHIFASEGLTFDRVRISEAIESPGFFELDNMSIGFADDAVINSDTFDDVVELDSVTVGARKDSLAATGSSRTEGIFVIAVGVLAIAVLLRRKYVKG